MPIKKSPLYESVFKFKELLQYLKDKSFSDEVYITMRLEKEGEADVLCVDIEVPRMLPNFSEQVIVPWVHQWFSANIPISAFAYDYDCCSKNEDTLLISYRVWVSMLVKLSDNKTAFK